MLCISEPTVPGASHPSMTGIRVRVMGGVGIGLRLRLQSWSGFRSKLQLWKGSVTAPSTVVVVVTVTVTVSAAVTVTTIIVAVTVTSRLQLALQLRLVQSPSHLSLGTASWHSELPHEASLCLIRLHVALRPIIPSLIYQATHTMILTRNRNPEHNPTPHL